MRRAGDDTSRDGTPQPGPAAWADAVPPLALGLGRKSTIKGGGRCAGGGTGQPRPHDDTTP